jgi:hypothetical protein
MLMLRLAGYNPLKRKADARLEALGFEDDMGKQKTGPQAWKILCAASHNCNQGSLLV